MTLSLPSEDTTTAIMLSSGTFDKVHYGLTYALSCLANDIPTIIYINMAACRAFIEGTNPLQGGWQSLPLSQEVKREEIQTAVELNHFYRQRGIVTWEELIDHLAVFSPECWVCEMGLQLLGVDISQLLSIFIWKKTALTTFVRQRQVIHF